MPQVLCFGDSNTHGSPPTTGDGLAVRFGPEVRWPGVMAGALGARWHLIEEGLGGRTTVHEDPIEGVHKSGLAALPIVLESHQPLDVFVLMLGTNDLKARFAVPAFDIARSIERLIGLVQASAAGRDRVSPPRLLLIAPPPILETGHLALMFKGGASKSQELGLLCREVAKRRQVGFLDAGKVIRSSDLDGIHFDEDQHRRLGLAVAEMISSWA